MTEQAVFGILLRIEHEVEIKIVLGCLMKKARAKIGKSKAASL